MAGEGGDKLLFSEAKPSRTLIKQLLRHLAHVLPQSSYQKFFNWSKLEAVARELCLYRYFLDHCVHFDTDLNIAGELPSEEISALYGEEEIEPAFLTFHNYGGDLGKLCTLLSLDLVIFFRATPGSGKGKKNALKWFDSRLTSQLTADSVTLPLFFFEVVRDTQTPILVLKKEEEANLLYSPGTSESKFISQSSLLVSPTNGCYLETLLQLLSLKFRDKQRLPKCPSLFSLMLLLAEPEKMKKEDIFSLFDGLTLVLATHQGTEGRFRFARKKKGEGSGRLSAYDAKNQTFRILTIFESEKRTKGEKENVVVVCVTFGGRMYIPLPPFSRKVKEGLKFPSCNPLKVDGLLGDMRKDQMEKDDDEEEEHLPPPYVPCCTCSLCQDGAKYYPNFTKKGGKSDKNGKKQALLQRPFRSYPDLLELMKIFSLDSPENLTAYEKACQLSISSMDVESMTEQLSGHASDYVTNIKPLMSIRLDSSPRRVQKIVDFAHLDFLREEGESRTEQKEKCHDEEGEKKEPEEAEIGKPAFFRVTKETSMKKLALDYLRYLKERQAMAEEKKKRLLRPLFETVAVFKKAHVEFSQKNAGPNEKKSDIEKRAATSFRSSIFGLLEKRLIDLTRSYYVFCYNGRSYDFVLLSSHLTCAAGKLEPPARFHFLREGNKIRSMRLVGAGIYFRDLCDLSGPRKTLASMAKTCGMVNLQKEIFPFSQVDCLEALDCPQLTRDKRLWQSELSGKVPSDEEIQNAHQIFERKSMSNLREFLEFYLLKDVKLLLFISARLLDRFYRLLGSHPIDAHRLTIASFSSFVCQQFLFQHRRPAMFSPQIPSLYSSIKSCCRGGLVQVLRHENNVDDKSEGARLNSHLISALCGKDSPTPSCASTGVRSTTAVVQNTSKRALRNNSVIQQVLKEWGDGMLPHQSVITKKQPHLSTANAMQAAHDSVCLAEKIFCPDPLAPSKQEEEELDPPPLGRVVDLLNRRTEDGSHPQKWLLSKKEREEGAQHGRFTFYLDETGKQGKMCKKTRYNIFIHSLGLYSGSCTYAKIRNDILRLFSRVTVTAKKQNPNSCTFRPSRARAGIAGGKNHFPLLPCQHPLHFSPWRQKRQKKVPFADKVGKRKEVFSEHECGTGPSTASRLLIFFSFLALIEREEGKSVAVTPTCEENTSSPPTNSTSSSSPPPAYYTLLPALETANGAGRRRRRPRPPWPFFILPSFILPVFYVFALLLFLLFLLVSSFGPATRLAVRVQEKIGKLPEKVDKHGKSWGTQQQTVRKKITLLSPDTDRVITHISTSSLPPLPNTMAAGKEGRDSKEEEKEGHFSHSSLRPPTFPPEARVKKNLLRLLFFFFAIVFFLELLTLLLEKC